MDVQRNTFNPNGSLCQMEYAKQAVKSGCSIIGICTNNCVVLTAEKRIISWMSSTKKVDNIVKIDAKIVCAMSGFTADGRQLVEQARGQCQKHWFNYDESMPIESCIAFTSALTMKTPDFCNNYCHNTDSRPFGVSLLFAGLDNNEPQLWHLDPDRTYGRHSFKTMGKGNEKAQSYLELHYQSDMDSKDAIELSLCTIQQVMKEKLSSDNIEVMYMTKNQKQGNELSEGDLEFMLSRTEMD